MHRIPGSPLSRPVASLVEAANLVAPPLSLDEAFDLHRRGGATFVDIREPKEIEREGTIPGAYRAPRGMVEFWVDPESPYYRAALDDGRPLVLFCASAWRSALTAATLIEMGRSDVAHVDGGFTAWRDAGHPVDHPEAR
ncbi:rhodanese [Tessaracoccus aquimaris]|uniref:Rhodanese n=1 Tax=Tessaracoccus aquimaris TaxID=1332264 RepID=A0A1Q2CPS7_9ACTN|nr:rhodanese-like domain-containing protein [Tessaracoccus aquimaris]AQP48119.1 rhodanese [Tessaracoccus aquimaris]